MSFAGVVIDVYDDKTFDVARSLEGIEKVGQMNLLSPEQHAALPDQDFALVFLTKHASIQRKFPIIDYDHAWLSDRYFQQSSEKMAMPARIVAATNIRDACKAFDIAPSPMTEKYAFDERMYNTVAEGARPKWLTEAMQKIAQYDMEKTASFDMASIPDNMFALVIENDGEVIRKYAMPDGKHVKIAADYFSKYAMEFPPEYRHQYAQNVLRRSEELGVDIDSPTIKKWASSSYNDHVDHYLEARRALIPRDEQAQQTLSKLASLRHQADSETFARAVSVFDENTGLTQYYDRAILDPWATTMGEEKVAGWHEDLQGDTITESDLQRAAESDKIRGYFGQSFHDQFKKSPVQIFSSLPTPEKVVIKQIARGEI